MGSRIELMLERLTEHKRKNEKVLIFSHFTAFLDILEKFIDDEGNTVLTKFHEVVEFSVINFILFVFWGYEFCRIDGSTKSELRPGIVEKFKQPDVGVFLLSLKSDSEGLTLVEANHVYFMSPWWNPKVESQSEDRAHR